MQHVLATEPCGGTQQMLNSMPRFMGKAAAPGRNRREAYSDLFHMMLKPPPGLFEPNVTPLLAAATPAVGAAVHETDAHDSETGGSSCGSTTDSLPAVGLVAAASRLQKEHGDPAPAENMQKTRLLLSLDDAVPEAFALGSAERPTVGSSYHHLSLCKPCAHVFSKRGCWNGVNCEFCHLCERGELKRRQMERRAFKQALKGIARMQR